MADATLILKAEASHVDKAKTSLDSLTTSAAKAEKAALGLAASTDKAATSEARLATAAASAQTAVLGTGNAMQINGAHMANMSFQMNDIATMLASGQSPFVLAMQQGLQMSQIFGQAGVKSVGGAMAMLKGSIASLINPLTLLTVGFVGLAAAAVGWAISALKSTADMEDVMDRHADSVERLKELYGEAREARDQLSNYSRILEAQEGLDLAIREQDAALQELGRQLRIIGTEGEDAFNAVVAAMQPQRAADLREELARLAVEASDPAMRELYETLAEITDPLAAAQDATLRLEAEIAALQGTATDAQLALLGLANASDEFADALDRVREIGLPTLTDAEELMALGGVMNQTGTTFGRMVGSFEVGVAQLRLKQREAEDEAEEASRAATRTAQSRQRAIDDTIASLRSEAEQIHLNGIELARYNALQAAGIDATDAWADEVIAAADALYYAQEAQDALTESQEAFEEKMATAQDIASSFFDTFRSGLESGKSAIESLGDALGDLRSRLLDMVMDVAIQRLFQALTGILGPAPVPAVAGGVGFNPNVVSGYQYHSGGVVGMASPSIAADPLLFAGANRFARGGIAGLGPDEIPIIAHRNEEVIRRDDPRHRWNGGDDRDRGTVVIIENHGGGEVQRKSGEMPDGRAFERIIIGAVKGGIARGDFNAEMLGKYGAVPRRISR